MKKITKYLSLIIIVVSLFTAFAVQSFAADEEAQSVTFDGVGTFYYTVTDNEITITKFETDETGITLEIPSEYEGMKITKIGDEAFKNVNSDALAKVVVPDTVTYIGKYAFSQKYDTAIILPDTLTYIDDYAFEYCYGLDNLVIPENAEYLGSYAFKYCTFETLEMKDQTNLKTGSYVFEKGSCSSGIVLGDFKDCNLGSLFGYSYFSNITFGDMENVTTRSLFWDSNVRNVTFGNMKNSTLGGNPFGVCGSLQTLTFGDVENLSLPSEAFTSCTKLESVTFGNLKDVTIGSNAFISCQKLKNVTFGTCENVSIKNYAFSKSGIISITIPEGVKLGQYVFSECPNLETAIILGTPLTQIEKRYSTTTGKLLSEEEVYSEYLFQKCPALKEVTLSNYEIVYQYMFYNCTALEKVTLGATKKIDKYGFMKCSSLKEVNFENNLEIAYMAFESCTSLEYFDLTRVDKLGMAGFRYCTSLKNIDLSNFKTISSEAFYGCTSLENIDLSNIEVIYSKAFGDCDGLKEVHINNNIQFDNQVFYGCSNLEKVYIDDNVQYIYLPSDTTVDDIFEECNNLKYFYIGKSFMPTVKVDDYVLLNTDSLGFFFMTSLEEIEVSPENPYYFTDEGVLYVDEGEVVILLCYPAAKQGEYYSTENALKNIEKDFSINILAFSLNQSIKEVNFTKDIVWPEFMDDSDSMKSYELLYRSFFNCSVEKVTFPENGLKIIGHYMFSKSQIKEIDLTGVEEILRGAFSQCPNLEEVNLLSCTIICDDAFSRCTSLKTVNAPVWYNEYAVWYDRWEWATDAFYQCTALETVNVPSLTILPEYCFYGCTSLKTVKADACTDVERYCFYGCESLESFEAPLCDYVYEYAFYGCSSLESVDMKLITINDCSFANCTSLKTANFEKTRYIEDNAFAGCTSLEIVNLCGVTRIRPYAFSGCTGLTLAIFDNTSCTIYENAFANCPNLSFDCEEDSEAYNYAIANNIPFTAIKVSFQNDTYQYTGNEIEPSIIVSINGMALVYNQDYVLTFENNTKVGTAKVTIHFIGNFEGLRDAERTFRIVACDISNVQIEYVVDNEYSGEEVRPKVVVKYGDKILIEDVDYTITYNSGTDAGSMFFTVTGKGNYTGSIDCYYNIVRRDIAEATVSKDNDMVYTGEELEPKPVITWNGFTLVEDADYEIRYFENINSGYGTMVIYGLGNFCGTQRVQFRIFGKSLENAELSAIPDQIYTGNEITPEISVTLDGVTLVKDTDYTVKYENNIEKGTATVIISGIGNYSGVAKQNFNIIKTSVYSFTVFSETEMTETYDGTPLKPEMEVYYGTELLTEGVDYTISLQNNVNAGTSTVTIIGIGLYDGERSYDFTILPCEITENDISVSGNMEFSGAAVEPEITVFKNGATLVEGEDYTVTHSNNNAVGTALVTIEGVGNYCDTVKLEYEIYSNEDDYVGLVKMDDGVWYYVENDEIDYEFTGLWKHTNGIWYYIQNGALDWSFKGLVKHTNGIWYYLQNAQIDWSFKGLVKHTNGIWYYIQKSQIDWSYKGLVKHTNGIWYYVQKSQIDWSFEGLVKHTNGIWYYVQKSQINWSYTGLVKHTNGTWYYVQKGQINWSYTGYVTYNGAKYKVENGVKV